VEGVGVRCGEGEEEVTIGGGEGQEGKGGGVKAVCSCNKHT